MGVFAMAGKPFKGIQIQWRISARQSTRLGSRARARTHCLTRPPLRQPGSPPTAFLPKKGLFLQIFNHFIFHYLLSLFRSKTECKDGRNSLSIHTSRGGETNGPEHLTEAFPTHAQP